MERWREGEKEREGTREEGGMFHFRLMICTVRGGGPDHEAEEDQPTAGRADAGTDFWNGVPLASAAVGIADGDQNQGVHETAAAPALPCPFPDTRWRRRTHVTPNEH